MNFDIIEAVFHKPEFPMQNGETITVRDTYGNVVETWYVGAQIDRAKKDKKTGEVKIAHRVYKTIHRSMFE